MLKFLNTKKGFTLVELIIVMLVIGILTAIAIPSYNAIQKSANIKVCRLQRKDLALQAQNWCVKNNFNDNFNYCIVTSDGKTPKVVAHEMALSEDQIYLLETDIHPHLCCCPSLGVYTVVVVPQISGIPQVVVTCSGGDDSGLHKDPE